MSTDEYIQHVLDVVGNARRLGARRLPDGTELIGHVPHVAPQAWLHVVFRPLSGNEIDALQSKFGRPLPPRYVALLLTMNGLRLFSGALSIDGFRQNYERTTDAIWQPFSVLTPNINERPVGSHHDDFYVGGYKADGSLLYLDSTGAVRRRARNFEGDLNTWPSLAEMLSSEADRLSTMFDDAGRRLHPNLSTSPVAHSGQN